MTDTTLSGNRVLVTGAGSGLGKYIASQINCVALTRDNCQEILAKYKTRPFDLIIHCAFNSSKYTNDYYGLVEDNIFLTRSVSLIPHHKFVFLSSVDVYRDVESLYKTTKLMAESIVQKLTRRPLVLRCGAILGEAMRKNSLRKIIEDEKPELSLSGDSTFNYILQKDILSFIETAYRNKYSGVIDFVSSGNINLSQVADLLGKEVKFGNYIYKTPNLPNQELVEVFPTAALSSENNIQRYLGNNNE
jgi:nucleoside-diphosphate-sugar epimerase